MVNVKILAKTKNPYTDDVITTFLLTGFPWRLLCEFNTHRQITKNTESSRARPVESVIEQVLCNPYIPKWTRQQKGMSGGVLASSEAIAATDRWLNHRDATVDYVLQTLERLPIHKQDVNSYLHPWMRVSMICTATEREWGHFFRLRTHESAKPCFRSWALEMMNIYYQTNWVVSNIHRVYGNLNPMAICAKIGSISYAKHAEERSEGQLNELAAKLVKANPIHISPFQHVAFAVGERSRFTYPSGRTSFAVDYHGNPLKMLEDYRAACYDEMADLSRVVCTANYAGWVSVASMIESLADPLAREAETDCLYALNQPKPVLIE